MCIRDRFIGWFCLKIGTAYRLAAGTGFGEKLLGLGQTIGARCV